jgi:nucleoid-associated protein EbfC
VNQEVIRNVFKSLGNLANIGNLMKQAQEMSGRMQALQEQLKTKRTTGAAGGGMVEVDVNGLGEVLAVRIEAALVDKGEREMIEDLLPAAINAAQTKAKQLHAEAMQSLAGELPIAGLSEALMQLGGGEPESGNS